ncbi:MAG: transketolase, partial [Rhodothermales bacterium]|nr:transketolase [Rhodothermales bacterium]
MSVAQTERLSETDLDQLVINTIRFLAVDAVQKADSGHPGMPMGAAPMAWVLWSRFLRHNPKDPDWPNRDRFVLSAGHGSMLLYALLHLTGYDLPMEELKNFRQYGSRTPGHPENFVTPGVETTTGPLGQGFANGVGMAIAERMLAARFNRPNYALVDHYTYGIVSDGDLMEGISHEAASLAGHLGLGKLIYLYDDNEISIDGSTDLAFTEDVDARFEAYGWHVARVEDGNDLAAIEAAIEAARAEKNRPSLIVVRTVIGYGSPNKADTADVHGSPLGEDEVRRTKENLGWPVDATFHVPEAALEKAREAVEQGARQQAAWIKLKDGYRGSYPDLGATYDAFRHGVLPEGWEDAV